MRRLVLVASVALLAAAGGYLLAMRLAPAPSAPASVPVAAGPAVPGELVGQRRPDFEHRDTAGRLRTAREFDGRPLLLNFWATWCAPCVEEMPMLSELQRANAASGLQVLGIALDDAERAAAFAADLDLAYPVLLGDVDVVLTGRRYGNRSGMLPFTVLIDAGGIIRWARLGALERDEVERKLAALR